MNSSEVVALAVEEVGLQGIPPDPACHECGATDMTVGRCDRCGRGICTEHDFIPGDWDYESDLQLCPPCGDSYEVEERAEIVQRGLSRNTRRLLSGLVSREVIPHGASFHIARNLGQGMMNKAAGELAPTWMLYANPMYRAGRRPHGGSPTAVFHGGRRYEGLQSHMPLTWILKQPAEAWVLGPHEDGRALELVVDELPPSWGY